MSTFEMVLTLVASVMADRLAFRWAKADLTPWVRWLQGDYTIESYDGLGEGIRDEPDPRWPPG